MRRVKEVLRLRFELGLGQRQIARCCGMGLGTVHDYLERALAAEIGWPLPEGLGEEELEAKLFGNQPVQAGAVRQRPEPDWNNIHQQLRQHRHLTLQLVWEEYRQANPEGYRYSWFCERYQHWRRHRGGVAGSDPTLGPAPPMPTPQTTQAVGVINGLIYVVAGTSCYTCPLLAITQIYDPAADTWSTGAPLPVATSNGPTGAVVKNILYVFGGGTESEGVTSAVWAYNPKKNSWSSKSPMPTARGCATATVEKDIIYVIGGCGEDPYDRLTTVESYNPATDTWTEEAPLLVGKSQPSVARVGTTIVAADGYTVSGDTGDNEGYDATTNSWMSLAPDPMPRNGACTGVIAGKMYVASGIGSSTESFNLKLSKNAWKTLAPMPQPTQFPGSAVHKGLLYCFGGFWASGLNNVQIYQP